MRYTHRNMPRNFQVPCGIWLIPTVGSLLCILLMISISKETVYRFLVWTAIGQIIYFSYGFWHSKRRHSEQVGLMNKTVQSIATVEDIMMTDTQNGSELDLSNETIANEVHSRF